MGSSYRILLTLCWSLIVVVLAATDLEVKVTPDTGLDPKIPLNLNNKSNFSEKTGGLKSDVESDKVQEVKKGKDQVGGSKETVEDSKLDERNPGEQENVKPKGDQDEKKVEDGSVGKGDIKEGNNVQKKGEDSSVEKGVNKERNNVGKKDAVGSMGKGDNKEANNVQQKDEDGSVGKGGNKDGLSEGSESKEVMKEVPESLPPVRKEGSRGEECDASNSCKAEKDALIACLRVPGNDSPDLSLLIQNKGNDPLSVMISAPKFVQLEKTKIQLRQKEDIKVKVSITEVGIDSLIVLTAGNGTCSLDFRELTSVNFVKETDYSRKSIYINLVKRPHFIAFIVFSALLLITVSTWMCVSFKRRHFDSNASKYQKLDMELPVSVGGKIVSESNDVWDNNWDDNWDDEEAPKTPSMPVTPSLSSKGLASRRLNKDAWKD